MRLEKVLEKCPQRPTVMLGAVGPTQVDTTISGQLAGVGPRINNARYYNYGLVLSQ